jgi:ubiquinone/menaquinone biosynthesis C-methylase UbiE
MNDLSNVSPWDCVADGYEASAKPIFSEFAAAAMDLVGIRPGQSVADIACGPGTLTILLSQRGADVSAIDFSTRMLHILERNMALANLDGVSVQHGDGQALPFRDGQFDATFSLFGLMFFPDREKGYSEMFRTLRDGGTACVSSWAQLSLCPLFDVMAQTIARLDPSRRPPRYDLSSLENPEVLMAEMRTAGFEDVVVHRIERSFEFKSAQQLWHRLNDGSAPIAVMKSRLPAAAWDRLCDDAMGFLDTQVGPFPTKLGATAWIGVGRKPMV